MTKPQAIETVGALRAHLKYPKVKKASIRIQIGHGSTVMLDISKAAALRSLAGLKDSHLLESANLWVLDEEYSFVAFGMWA